MSLLDLLGFGAKQELFSPKDRMKLMMDSPLIGPMTKYWLQGGGWDRLNSDTTGPWVSPFSHHFPMMLPPDQQKLLREMHLPGYYSDMPQVWKGTPPYMPMREYGPDLIGKPKRSM